MKRKLSAKSIERRINKLKAIIAKQDARIKELEANQQPKIWLNSPLREVNPFTNQVSDDTTKHTTARINPNAWAALCEHANETPESCQCNFMCYCRSHTCAGKPVKDKDALRRKLCTKPR